MRSVSYTFSVFKVTINVLLEWVRSDFLTRFWGGVTKNVTKGA